MIRRTAWLIVPLALTSLSLGCEKKEEKPTPPAPAATTTAAATANAAVAKESTTEVEIDPALLPAFGALPAAMESKDNALTEDKITLGRALYYDTRLSAGKDISCNTCHNLAAGGVDNRKGGQKTSEGHKGQLCKRNSPTVYNAAGHFVQFWDGRAKNVEEQAKGPILNPVEMAMPNEKAVIAEISKVKWYKEQFKKAFPDDKDPVSYDNLAKAIGAFERKLVTPSRWDKFVAGDTSALTSAEKAGFKKFTEAGCNACHAGPYLGGAMYQKLGLAKPWTDDKDLGRYEITKAETDKMFFKVPSLRNIEKTAPYFHDGSVATLDEAVKLMARHELGKELSDADTASIVVWLKALSGDVPADYVSPASLPAEVRPKDVGPAASAAPKPAASAKK